MILALFLSNLTKISHSSPWLQKPKRLEVINNIVMTSTSDNLEELSSIMFNKQSATTQLTSLYYNTYMEYGVSKNNTIGLNMLAGLFYVESTNGEIKREESVYGIPFIELFYRRSVISYKNFIWSIEPIIKLPAISANDPISNEIFKYQRQVDFEIKTNFGLSFGSEATGLFGADGKKGHFMGASVGYRNRTELSFDEIRITLMYGFHLNKYLTFILEFFKILNISKVPTPNNNLVSSYHFGKLTFYIIANLNEATSLVTGITVDVAQNFANINMNGYGGTGLILGFWQKF